MIRVADTGNWKYNILVAIHELIESGSLSRLWRNRKAGRPLRPCAPDEEDPGTHPKAPYRIQHLTAMGVEMILAACMGVNWRVYEDALDAIYYTNTEAQKASLILRVTVL